MIPFDCPSARLLEEQSAWLASARSRLFRRVQIAGRRRVLDLGCGPGAVTAELVRRARGKVVALDRSLATLRENPGPLIGAYRVCGEAARLPLAPESFDLVFCQFALLWMDMARAVWEIHRVLRPDGVLVALEPDYGGLIEHPPELATRALWLKALARAGADPCAGRKLPCVLAAAGFEVRTDLLDRLPPPSPVRFELLRELPLTEKERRILRQAEAADAACPEGQRVVHLPMFLVTATKSSR
jgi:SAM-dependent methyltransferase